MKKELMIAIFMIFTLISSIAFAEDITGLNLNGLLGNTNLIQPKQGVSVGMDAIIRVQLNGQVLDFTDDNGAVSNPKIINNRTMVPMRKIFETFNAQVDWNEDEKVVIAKTNEKEIMLKIDDAIATLKDIITGEVKTTELDQAPVIKDNRTLVPVRFIAEGLDKEVGWDNSQRTVIILDKDIFAKKLERELPVLKKIFDMNIEANKSYTSTSNISGKLSYEDLKNQEKSENMSFNGTANIKVNANEDMEADVIIASSGSNGEIIKTLEEQGMKNIDLKFILKDGKVYLGTKRDKEYEWMDATGSFDRNSVPTLSNTVNDVKSFDDLVNLLSSTLGDVDSYTYERMDAISSLLKKFINEDTIKIRDNGFDINLDMKKLVQELTNSNNLPFSNLVLNASATVTDHRITAEKTSFKFNIESLSSLENLEVDITIDTKYDTVNQDFAIEVPKI